MRLLGLLPLIVGLSACAGNLADYVGPRAPIITPQLARYGLDEQATQCVGLHLGNHLTPLQLRRFARQSGAIDHSLYGEPSLTLRDLTYIASQMPEPAIAARLEEALEDCDAVRLAAAESEDTSTGPAEAAAPRGPTWLNLGAASTGQSIAVDAASLKQEGQMRTAWFRLSNPGNAISTGITYLLRIDCSNRTISPQADRRQDQDGNVIESRDYGPDEQGPLPIEGGTVMEIAYLSLCT